MVRRFKTSCLKEMEVGEIEKERERKRKRRKGGGGGKDRCTLRVVIGRVREKQEDREGREGRVRGESERECV